MAKLKSLGKSARIKSSPCTNCGKKLDMASGLNNDKRPSPGDVTVCLGCGHIMVFSKTLRLRDPNNKELIAIAGREEIIAFNNIRESIIKKT